MSAASASEAALNFNAGAAIVGALGIILLALFVLLVIWRLCNGRDAAAAQRAHVPFDDVITDITPSKYWVTASANVFVTQDGMFCLNERGHWVPFDEKKAA